MFGRLIGLVSLSALAVTALAGPQTYAQRSQNIRAGIVILDSAKASIALPPQSAAPYALFNLDSNSSIKPTGWNIYNPYAPTTMTQTIYNRWSLLDGNTGAVGTRISKRNAPYWEVFLSQVTDTVLANYDFLVLNPLAYASLNPTEQQRLRRFVDNGGVLWIDPAGLTPNAPASGYGDVDQFNNFPIAFLPTIVNGSGGQQTDFTSSLMNNLQQLNANDINVLDQPSNTSYVVGQVNYNIDNASGVSGIAGSTIADYFRFQTVSQISNGPTISVARIGAGVVVVTARGASIKLNRSQETSSYTGNIFYQALDPILEQDGLSAAKLAVNMIGLLGDARQQGSDSRKSSSSAIDLKPPMLLTAYSIDQGFSSDPKTSSGFSTSTPALYKGLLVSSAGGILKVYNATPTTNIDNDSTNDAGYQDYSLGAPHDLIWQSTQFSGSISAPVCAEVPGASGGRPTDVVMVVDNGGNLNIFNLTPRNNDGTLAGGTGVGQPIIGYSPYKQIAPPTNSGSYYLDSSISGVPIAPTVHEGIAYVTDNVQRLGVTGGRIWQVDLQQEAYVSSSRAFEVGGTDSQVTLPEFSYGATVGYIPILDNSGGVDKVLYAPFTANTSAGVNGCGFTSLWLGSKGEVPTSYEPMGTDTATALTVTTRASNNTFGALPIYTGTGNLGVKLTLLDGSGNPLSDVQMSVLFTGTVQDLGGGVLSFPFKGAINQLPSTVTGVRVDYNIDWGSALPGVLTSVERGRIILPDVAQTPARTLNGGVALSPQGTIYVVNSTEPSSSASMSAPNVGGGLYGFREQGRGQFVCVSRYELYGPHTIVLNQAGSVKALGALSDYDSNLQAAYPQYLGQTLMTNFHVMGGPSIRNGQVFVTAQATKPSNGTTPVMPATVVLAFNAEPQTPTFNVGNLADGTEILQPDFARSTVAGAPENQTVLASGTYIYDSANGVISFPNLMSNSQGQIQNCLSLSQPIIVRQPGSADVLVYPDTIGGAVWSPLQWFYVLDGMYPSGSAPVVTGNSVFVSCDSYLPNILSNNGFATSAVVYAFNAQISSSQLHPVPGQAWLNQLWTVDTPGGTADPNILWPQLGSVTSFPDFIVKLNQTKMGASTLAFGIVGGDNVLAGWGDQGLFTFKKSSFLICDEGRLVELDPSGNPIWASSTSQSAGPTSNNGAANTKPLVRPSRAYQTSPSSILFADPGANRVASMNTNGIETRSITGFQLDPGVAPALPTAGYAAGESLNLSGPRDVLYYTSYTTMSNATTLVSMGDGENGNNVEFWEHYLVADTGNKRLVEIIDRFYYDPTTQLIGQPVTVNGNPQIGVLLWHSPAAQSGKQYNYISVNRVNYPDANGGHYVYVTGVSGNLPTAVGVGLTPQQSSSLVDAQDGSGGIVIYDPANPAGVVVFNQMSLPDVSGTSFWDPNTGAFDSVIDQTTTVGLQTYARRKGGLRRFSNLNSVTTKLVQDGSGNPLLSIMVADGTGVYEMSYGSSLGATQSLTVDWMMPNEVFRVIQQTGSPAVPSLLNPIDLRAMFARRLDSGEVLIVNGYYGNLLNGNPFTGEVMQVNGTSNYNTSATNLGFNSQSITLDLRTAGTSNFRGLVLPVFADRR